MIIRSLRALRQSSRRIRTRISPCAVVLLYHRIAELALDPQLLCVMREHFAEQLEVIRRNGYCAMGVSELAQRLRTGNLPHRAVVMTFDDGYVDNLNNAKPLLERYDMPATVFVTAGYVGCDREFWWDELERLLLQQTKLPDILRLNVRGKSYQWALSEAVHHGKDDNIRNRRWNVLAKGSPSPRHEIYRTLCQVLGPMSRTGRDAVLAELAEWVGDQLTVRSDYCPMTPDELIRLADGEFIEIGAHTMTHPILAGLAPAAQKAEVIDSKKTLESILGRRISAFSYPFGGRNDYTSDTVRLVRDAGYDCACSNFPGLVTPKSDSYQLPRFLVRDWDGEEFAYRLDGYFRS